MTLPLAVLWAWTLRHFFALAPFCLLIGALV